MDENMAIPLPTDSLDTFWSGALPFTEHPAVVYLASPGAAMVTGHALPVDGGWTAM